MSTLNSLKLITAKKSQSITPVLQRRNKLLGKLWEQLEMAKAQAEGRHYAPTKFKLVKNNETGERRNIETLKRVKQWWWTADNGKFALSVRYGSKIIALTPKANAIECGSLTDVIDALTLLCDVVKEGGLDAQIEQASKKLREGFGK